MRILVVEDDHRVARGLTKALARAGFDVSRAMTVADALAAAPADIVLLDLNLPDGDGLTVCRRLRQRHDCGVIILSARAGPDDRVLGLRTGADDYVVKPFGMAELLARIEAVARRTRADRARDAQAAGLGVVSAGGLAVDLDRREATLDGRPIDLTPKEFDLLRLLAAHAGRVCSRSMILDQVWGAAYEAPTRTLDVHVAAVRAKLGPAAGVAIRTVRGVGYQLDAS